jgi:hypothetical protein
MVKVVMACSLSPFGVEIPKLFSHQEEEEFSLPDEYITWFLVCVQADQRSFF